MRTIILALLLLPFTAFSQTQTVFIKLTDANGLQINGLSNYIGYEKNIIAETLSSAGTNNSQVLFTMAISGASADLKRSMLNNTPLRNGLVVVTQPSGLRKPLIMYTITMENITVTGCDDKIGCNGVLTTEVVLSPGRIGWTYYQTEPSGKQTVSGKTGYDFINGKTWEGF